MAAEMPARSNTPPRSGPAPMRLLRVCLDNRVLGGVEVSEASTLADVRESICEDEIQGVPDIYQFLFSGAPVSRRQEARRRALVCFPSGFLTIIPENAVVVEPQIEGVAGATGASPVGNGGVTPSSTMERHTMLPSHAPVLTDVEAEAPREAHSDAVSRTGGAMLELCITDGPLEGTTVTVGEEGARVGRHTSNSLVIPEAGISRYHCEVRYIDGGFCIRDLGSVTGTFFYLKPHGRFKMFDGLMVKLGETEFQVLSQSMAGDDAWEQLVHFFEGPFVGHKAYIPAAGIRIGRRHDNNLVITTDGTVSAYHATIFCEGGDFYISDLGSCNGTCVRMGMERTESDWHPIMDGDILGAGCTKMVCRVASGGG
eukprot:TRINITY_DN56890_c0_g1_i1.p1 TRINITY_DN56890_c0_g1~~TRINITY_DN56890_c0_g1_i1.p1  ORF type:complete len:370 (+),score=60.87 TRINITY_DN56890_c0_g1_i1:169-1278(+)